MIEYYKNLVTLSHPHPFPLAPGHPAPPGRDGVAWGQRGFTPSPPKTGERVGGCAGVSVGMPTACATAVQCSGQRALQGRGMLTAGFLVNRKLSIEKSNAFVVVQVTDS
jgi:hypothetical protein